MLLSSGIAAIVAVGVSIVMIASFPQPATAAAANLDRAAKVTQAYKGWVHVRTLPPEKSGPTTTPSIAENDGSMHMNTVDGALAVKFSINDLPNIFLIRPANRTNEVYNGYTHQIRVDDLTKDSSDRWAREAIEAPLQLADLLAAMTKEGGVTPHVKETRDGDLSRFELTFAGDIDKAPKRYRESMAAPMTIWTDPKTNLIRKMSSRWDGKVHVSEYTYGPPEIRDIYDLGVPRDATVIDARGTTPQPPPALASQPAARTETPDATVDLKALADGLDARIEKGFGDHVAVLCLESVLDPPQPMRREGAINLYARRGKRALQFHYLAVPAGAFMGFPGFPPGWPRPKLDDLLTMLDRVSPTSGFVSGFVTSGQDLWQIEPNLDAKPTATITKVDTFKAAPHECVPGIAAEIWPHISSGEPTKEMRAIGIPSPKIEVVRDAAQPKLLGIRVTQEMPLEFKGLKVEKWQQTVYWIDPERDDMPVETVMRSRPEPDDAKAESVTRHVYEKYSILLGTQWYPTQWRSEHTRPDLPPKQRVSRHVYSLQIFPNEKLESKWYADPNTRIKK